MIARHEAISLLNSHFYCHFNEREITLIIRKITFYILPIFGNFTILLKKNIMGRNTSISLGNHFESFIENSLSEGRYKNASEVVRAGLRLLEEEESKLIILKKAVEDGLYSGRAENFDPIKHLETLKAKKKNG